MDCEAAEVNVLLNPEWCVGVSVGVVLLPRQIECDSAFRVVGWYSDA